MEFEQTDDERGYCRRSVRLLEDGSLRIEGHDMGGGVEDFWGQGLDEYEFYRTVPPDGVQSLREILGLEADDDLLGDLHARFGRPGGTYELEQLLQAHGIHTEFWSRVGH
jgi:hypothetical protein